jgi:hypothetical protein
MSRVVQGEENGVKYRAVLERIEGTLGHPEEWVVYLGEDEVGHFADSGHSEAAVGELAAVMVRHTGIAPRGEAPNCQPSVTVLSQRSPGMPEAPGRWPGAKSLALLGLFGNGRG